VSDDLDRELLIAQVQVCFSRALRAHTQGIEPPSNYASTLASLAYTSDRDTLNTEAARDWYCMLMRDCPHPTWRPDSRDFLNWLFFKVSGLRRRHWEGLSNTDLEGLLHLLREL
jgi:hypothetical protein